MNSEFNEKIKMICKEYKTSYSTILKYKKEYKYLFDYIMSSTEKFNDLTFPARIFYTLNNLDQYIKCKICENDIPHNRKCNAITGYHSLCCS